MSEEENALSKVCAVCERTKILKTMDVCLSCGIAADKETQQDIPSVERFLEKHAAWAAYCETHGFANPFSD